VKERVSELEGQTCKSLTELKELADLRDEASTLETQVGRLRSCSDIMDYYYMTSDIITRYDDLVGFIEVRQSLQNFDKSSAKFTELRRSSLILSITHQSPSEV